MPAGSSISTWSGVAVTSATAVAALGHAQTAHAGGGAVMAVPKEGAAHLHQSNVGTQRSDHEIVTPQTGNLRQTTMGSLPRYRARSEEPARSSAPAHGAPTVFVVDEDASVRESITLLVLGAGWRAETYGSAGEFLRRPPWLVPSCLVLEASLPDLCGLELQKRLAVDRPDTPIIFIARRSDIATTVQAMKGGALEFLTRPFADDVLLNVVGDALKRSKIALDEDAKIRALRDRYSSLSCRERQVMASVVRGLLNKQVGRELGISEITVKAHRGRMMQKMAANSLPELVMMAARLGVSVPKF